MSWLSSFLHPERGYKAAQEQLNQYYPEAQGYMQPYNQQGQEQYGNLNQYIQNLMNPEQLQNQWAQGYQQSDAARNAQSMAQEHGLDAASAMGLMGSSPALSAIQGGTTQIGLNERQNYLNDLMEKYKMGAGLSQGIYGQGLQAAGQMGQNAMNMGQNSAGLQYNATNAPGQMFGKTAGTAANLALSYLTGGLGSGGFGRGMWSTGGK